MVVSLLGKKVEYRKTYKDAQSSVYIVIQDDGGSLIKVSLNGDTYFDKRLLFKEYIPPYTNINDVYKAFFKFQNSMNPAIMPDVKLVSKWREQAIVNRKKLKTELQEMGLAQYIDWDEWE